MILVLSTKSILNCHITGFQSRITINLSQDTGGTYFRREFMQLESHFITGKLAGSYNYISAKSRKQYEMKMFSEIMQQLKGERDLSET